MSTTPAWALALIYWLHMLATIVWIGGLAAVVLLILPAARNSLQASDFAAFLEKVQRRLDPAGWLSLMVLLGTGMFQMSASPNYQGFLAIGNRWAIAILVKHLVFIGMVAISAYLTWGLLPALRRAALQRARQLSQGTLPRLESGGVHWQSAARHATRPARPAPLCVLQWRIALSVADIRDRPRKIFETRYAGTGGATPGHAGRVERSSVHVRQPPAQKR